MAGPVLPEQPLLPPPAPPPTSPPSQCHPTQDNSVIPRERKNSIKIALEQLPHLLDPTPFWDINYLSFSTNPVSTAIFPPHLESEYRKFQQALWKYMLEQESGPGGELERRQHVMAVAVDEAGAVRAEEGVNGMIAGAIWEQPKIVKVVKIGAGQKEEDEEEEKKERETEKEAEREKFLMGLFPQGANKEFYGAIIKVLKEKKEELLGKDSDSEWWYLGSIFTHPSYQRLGAATLLLQWGQEQAMLSSRSNRRVKGCFLVATPMGLPLYLKCGFEVLGKMTFDVKRGVSVGEGKRDESKVNDDDDGGGEEGLYTYSFMVWRVPESGDSVGR